MPKRRLETLFCKCWGASGEFWAMKMTQSMAFFRKAKGSMTIDQVSYIYTKITSLEFREGKKMKYNFKNIVYFPNSAAIKALMQSIKEPPSFPSTISCMAAGHQTLGFSTDGTGGAGDSTPRRWLLEGLTHKLPQLLKLYRSKNHP